MSLCFRSIWILENRSPQESDTRCYVAESSSLWRNGTGEGVKALDSRLKLYSG